MLKSNHRFCNEIESTSSGHPWTWSGAGACERNWSAYDFVHSKNRNRLDPDRARDLVCVFTNMRLYKKAQKSEAFADWNKGEEGTQEEREAV